MRLKWTKMVFNETLNTVAVEVCGDSWTVSSQNIWRPDELITA